MREPVGRVLALPADVCAWRAAYEVLPHAVLTTDAEGRVDFANRRWRLDTGLAPDRAPAEAVFAALHPDDTDRVQAAWRAAVRDRAALRLECRVRRADGAFRHFSVAAEPRREPGGAFAGWVVVWTDVDDFHREVRESESRFRLAADASPVPLWMSGPDKLCDWFNRPWLDFTGRTMEQEAGNGWAEGVHPEDFDRCLEIYVSNFDERLPFSMQYRLRRHDGVYRWVLDNGVPRYGPDGEFVGYIGTGLDITPWREAEATLQASNTDLERRVQDRTAELRALNGELETFVYTASHDLRAPLLAIQGMSELLAEAVRAGDADEAAFLVSRVNRNVTKMGELLSDLLALSRAGRPTDPPEAVDLGGVMAAVAADLEPRLRGRGAVLELPATWPPVRYGRSDAYQVLLNLVGNAVKFGGRDGRPPRVRVSWSQDAGAVTLRVEDDGPGVEPRFRERVFGLFERLDAEAEGSGVGLAIVKRTAERHGGRVWVEDSALGGAAFAVTVPHP